MPTRLLSDSEESSPRAKKAPQGKPSKQKKPRAAEQPEKLDQPKKSKNPEKSKKPKESESAETQGRKKPATRSSREPALHEVFAEQAAQLEAALRRARAATAVGDDAWSEAATAARDARDALAALAASLFRSDVDLPKAKATLEQVRRCLDKGLGAEDCCRDAPGSEQCAVAAKAFVGAAQTVAKLLPEKAATKLLREICDPKVLTAWLRLAKRVSLGLGAAALVAAVTAKLKDIEAAHADTHAAAERSRSTERAKAEDAVKQARHELDLPAAAAQLAGVAADATLHGPSPLAEAAEQQPLVIKDLGALL